MGRVVEPPAQAPGPAGPLGAPAPKQGGLRILALFLWGFSNLWLIFFPLDQSRVGGVKSSE